MKPKQILYKAKIVATSESMTSNRTTYHSSEDDKDPIYTTEWNKEKKLTRENINNKIETCLDHMQSIHVRRQMVVWQNVGPEVAAWQSVRPEVTAWQSVGPEVAAWQSVGPEVVIR
ncbi:hypothetical protein M5K25_002825 [Dendrobium thyrsiflorum]|uniref:Uncharacterized protein n=1 Tax=Dendrobium thyrsiflorum TaxID=117978 RepID=A0ABD0VVT3_DENTH